MRGFRAAAEYNQSISESRIRRKSEMAGETSVSTNEVRLSYVHLFKPEAPVPGGEEKYSVTVLVPKTDVITKQRIDAAIAQAKMQGKEGKWGGIIPPIVAEPIHDGDGVRPSDGMEYGPECKGHWVFSARCGKDRKPEIVDSMGQPIIDPTEVYSGMYGRVYVTFYPYNFNGKKGIGCSLGPVMKTRDGEVLGGGSISAASAFGVQPPAAVDPITGLPIA
jgi:hypothetical protein